VKLHHDVTAKLSLNVKSSTLESTETEEKTEDSAPVEARGFKAKAKARHKQ
jgi:hypothetical protein